MPNATRLRGPAAQHSCRRRATRYADHTGAALAADDFNRTHPYAPARVASMCGYSLKRDQHWHVDRP